MKPAVELTNITVHRGKKQVLAVDRLTIGQGQQVAVIGPNGAGKSTLLQVVNLLLAPSVGQIRVYGRDGQPLDERAIRRHTSLVFQEPLLVHDSVFNNVALPLKLRGCVRREIEARVAETLQAFHCDHLADRLAQRLSGGEAQRVCLARALVCQPEILLLDEPFSALDPVARRALILELKAVARCQGMTVILVSQQLIDMLHYSERAVVIQAGRPVQDADPETVLRRPVNLTIAQLVGMDNILPCRMEKTAGQSVVHLGDNLAFPLGDDQASEGSHCCLPGDIFRLQNGALPENRPWALWEGEVGEILPGIGLYHATVKGGGLQLNLRVERETASRHFIPGARVQLAFDPREAHLVG
jgi:tungstate transport system ATP-binding protein